MAANQPRKPGSRPGGPALVQATYEDEDGRQWAVMVPVGQKTDLHMGIPAGPPDLRPLGMPKDVMLRLHKQLFNRRLLTRRDLRGRPRELFAAIQAAYRVDVAAVSSLYE